MVLAGTGIDGGAMGRLTAADFLIVEVLDA